MAIVCFQVSKTEKAKIMKSAGSNVISGVKKRKTTAKRKTKKRR
jgi:hypothetical protein